MSEAYWDGVIWACMDCMLSEQTGELDWEPDREPWSECDGLDIANGLTDELHECGIPFGERECDCDRREFSWSRCDGCGSTLGGERQAYMYRVISAH